MMSCCTVGNAQLDCEYRQIIKYGGGAYADEASFCSMSYHKTDSILPLSIKDSVRHHIVSQSGIVFFNHLELEYVRILDWGHKRRSINVDKKEAKEKGEKVIVTGWEGTTRLRCPNQIKYEFNYWYYFPDSSLYRIPILLNNRGNLISELELPEQFDDTRFQSKEFGLCNSLESLSDSVLNKIIPIKSAKIAYSKNYQGWCWLIVQDKRNYTGDSVFYNNVIWIDIQTGDSKLDQFHYMTSH